MNRDVMKEFGCFLFSILIWIDSLNLAKKKRWWCMREEHLTKEKGLTKRTSSLSSIEMVSCFSLAWELSHGVKIGKYKTRFYS